MIRRPPRSTPLYSSAASDVYKRQAVRRQEREGQGGAGRGHLRYLRPQRLHLHARHPHRRRRERGPAGSGALSEHRREALRRLPQARPGPGGRAMTLERTSIDTARHWPSGGKTARLAVMLVVAALLQTTVAPNIRILGANPDFALIIIVCVALMKGSETGAVFGFLIGMLTAIALMEPFGLSAFVFVLVGYGRRERPIRTGRRDKPIIQLPSVALRVAVMVGIAVVLFGIVLFRLWFLQILSGQEFLARANDNRLASVKLV